KLTRIPYSAKYYIVDSILTVLGLTISMVSLFVLDECVHWLIWLFYAIFTIISILGLFLLLWNIQWINIDNSNVSAHNIFGTVKRIEISEIKAMEVLNARAWGIKIYANYYPCIAISSRKTIKQADVEDAYNHKRGYYIIFPYTNSNIQKLQEAYIEEVGRALEINSTN
ncbi:MAG: hypothetical protein IJW96_01230, partial [Clostridia bacterium]|nr:hypothetical protein [Clostridia bacterium]